MKVLKEIKSYQAVDIEPIELTLLSPGEYLANKNNIPPFDDWWWLRTQGHECDDAEYVNSVGSIYCSSVAYKYMVVRPALKFNTQNLRVKDRFELGGHEWTVIAEGIALCDSYFCRMTFREDWNAHDANDYQRSDVKAYLDLQFERMKEGNE